MVWGLGWKRGTVTDLASSPQPADGERGVSRGGLCQLCSSSRRRNASTGALSLLPRFSPMSHACHTHPPTHTPPSLSHEPCLPLHWACPLPHPSPLGPSSLTPLPWAPPPSPLSPGPFLPHPSPLGPSSLTPLPWDTFILSHPVNLHCPYHLRSKI